MKKFTVATKSYSREKWFFREMTEEEVIAEGEDSAVRRGETVFSHTDIEWVGVGNVDEYGDYFDFAPSREWLDGEQFVSAIRELRCNYRRVEFFDCDDYGKQSLAIFKRIEDVQ